jgi:hypothetical protein
MLEMAGDRDKPSFQKTPPQIKEFVGKNICKIQLKR